jgi:hypothetical protein
MSLRSGATPAPINYPADLKIERQAQADRLDQARALGLLPPKESDAEFEEISDEG